jgi:hypothetical protein
MPRMGSELTGWRPLKVPVGPHDPTRFILLDSVGVYVTDDEMEVRRLFGSQRFAWRDVLAVRVQAISRGNTNRVVERAREICVDLADGSTVDLGIQGRARGQDRRTIWLPDLLPADQFDRVLAHLRDLVAQHRRAP